MLTRNLFLYVNKCCEVKVRSINTDLFHVIICTAGQRTERQNCRIVQIQTRTGLGVQGKLALHSAEHSCSLLGFSFSKRTDANKIF